MPLPNPPPELLVQLELYTTAFQRSPLFLSVADLANDHYLEVNDTFCQAVGYTRAEIIGHSAVELGLITPDGRDRLAREFIEMTAAAKKYPIEFEIRCRDGSRLNCRYWGELVQTAAGPRLFAAAENVTEFHDERRAREAALATQHAALRKSDERFALAMDAVSDGLWDWDLATDTSYFSPGYYRMLGLPLGALETSGLSWLSRVHPDDRPLLEQSIRECAAGRRPGFEGEYRLLTQKGDWLWVLGRGQPLGHGADGRAQRLLATHIDVTESKRLQLRLAQNDRLASLGMLSAGLGHEINNPLAYVMSSLELMLAQLTAPRPLAPDAIKDVVELAQNALEGAERVRKISRALSAFSRVEPAELQPVDLNLALDEAARMATAELRYRATLVRETSPLPPVRASQSKLVQVFLNLLVNAAHAVDDGKPGHRVTVRTWAADGAVFTEVRDTGPGMPREQLDGLFEPLFSTRPAGVGDSLGLAVSKRVVDECGGDIRVESVVGQGTSVIVKLVEYRGEGTPAPVVAPPAAARSASRRRVLLVDDEPLLRRTLARQLKAHHDVVAVASGAEAQAQLTDEQGFDAILCDLMMPEMSGMELHAWLVEQRPALAKRVIFMSGGAFTTSAAAYLSRVENPRLEKPFALSRVLDLLAELTGG